MKHELRLGDVPAHTIGESAGPRKECRGARGKALLRNPILASAACEDE